MFFINKRKFIFFMSRLNFSPLTEAFYLGSDQIKNTQDEISKLKKIISDSVLSSSKSNGSEKQQSSIKEQQQQQPKRIRYSDSVVATFKNNNDNSNNGNLSDTDLLKIIQHPKFDDIVKNYIIVKRPEWVSSTLNNTQYIPNNRNNNINVRSNFRETFGNTYATTVCSNVTNYIIFFIFALVVYLMLNSLFNKVS